MREAVDGRARLCGSQNFVVDSPVDLGTHFEYSAKLLICTQERMGAGHCEAYVDNATGAVHSYGDSKEMCGVAAGAIELGIIAQPTRLARTLLIDVGAAWSGEAIVGHKMGFQVAAFEARESEYTNIVRATRRFPGVDVVHAAVTDKAGPVELHMSADSSSLLDSAVHGGAERGKTKLEHNRVVTVQGVVLDEYVAMHDGRVAFLMLDVQGVEYNVLKGAINTLKEQKPVVMFEYDKRLGGWSADKVLCLLQSLGYECAFMGSDNAVCVPDKRARYLRGSRA